MGGEGTNYIPGDPGIFVANVRPGSVADGKLFIGDRIVAVWENITFPLLLIFLYISQKISMAFFTTFERFQVYQILGIVSILHKR